MDAKDVSWSDSIVKYLSMKIVTQMYLNVSKKITFWHETLVLIDTNIDEYDS